MLTINNIKYNTAIYIRISKEDEKNGDSESVENQKNLLLKYVKEKEYNLYDIYIDDGFTGTNFNRPDFKRMISDIELGKINMVITKDLSRLGRDYIETGEYIEKYFPMNNVRYISLLDGIDTYLETANNEIAPFKAIVNDMYSRDNSKKIRASLKSKQINGKWVGGCTPLGYKTNPKDKNHLKINDNEAWVVKKIFNLAGSGVTPYGIKEILNKEKIPTSAILRKKRTKNNINAQQGIWSVKTVKGILQNELYTGDLIQNRRNRISYKVRKIVENPRSEWIIVPNTHEALVERSEFERIQKLIKGNQTRPKKKVIRILDGLLYCFECKHRVSINAPRKNNKTYITCNYYRMYSKLKMCTSHQFNYDILEKKIIEIINKNINKYIDKNNLMNLILSKINKTTKKDITLNINDLKNNIEIKNKNLDKIYIDKIENIIDETMYLRIYKQIKDEIKILEDKLKKLINNNLKDKTKEHKIIINEFFKGNNYTRELMLKLINKIEVHNNKLIDIYFNFKG